MPRVKGPEKIRLNLEVLPIVKKRLDRLVGDSEADSMSEVVRRALSLYELVLKNRRRGGTLLFKSDTGVENEVIGY